MPYGEDYDDREVTYLESCGRSMDATVWAIRMVSMAELCRPVGKRKKRKKRTTEKATRRKKDAR